MKKTPTFGIPYPDGTTKAYKLGDELEAMGLGVESALLAAEVPAVTNANVRVAPSQAARDAAYGVPATEAARLALQATGALCVRTDRGWIERYYATYDSATNPAGAITPGWYQVAGGSLAGTPMGMSDWMTIGAAGAPAYASSQWSALVAGGWVGTAIRRLPGQVAFAGVVQRGNSTGSWPAGDLIFTLPVMWRPSIRARLWGEVSSAPVPITVEPDGRVIVQNAGTGAIAFAGAITL